MKSSCENVKKLKKRINNTVITKYYGEVIKTSEVSNIYEVFDIVNYIKNKIDLIENNFKINEYSLSIKGGVQDLKLVSDSVEINGINFSKVFYITNSTDKSRRLSFRVGLFSDRKNIHYVNSFKELQIKVTSSFVIVGCTDRRTQAGLTEEQPSKI